MDTERHNILQIEQLNQRGGRTLSIVDLIGAGTIDTEMAASACRAMDNGASILTGARPGGAGKTTLMAALLGFLPPDVPITTVDRPGRMLPDARNRLRALVRLSLSRRWELHQCIHPTNVGARLNHGEFLHPRQQFFRLGNVR